MIPAAKHAALKALKAGLDAAIDRTQDDTLAEATESGADRWRTAFGSVSVSQKQDSVEVADEAAFLRWVREHAPAEVVEQVRDSYRKAVLKQLQPGPDGTVVDARTGEVVEWAAVRPGGTRYLSVRDGADAKQAATAMVLAHLDEIAAYADPQELEGGERG